MVVVVAMAGACAFDASGALGGDAGGGDIDAARDIDAGRDVDAMQTTCNERCDGADLIECAGDVEQRTPCPMGCATTGGAHCGELVPSNGVTSVALTGVTSGLRVPEDTTATIEADSGRIVVAGGEVRGAGEGIIAGVRFVGGPPYNVFVFDHLEVARGATLLIRAPSATGSVVSPIIVYVRRDVEINGLVDITAGCIDGSHWCAGVGGGNGGTAAYLPLGCAPGGAGNTASLEEDTGAGGGGLGQNGAQGGDSNDLLGGAGGDTAGCPGPSLVPLEGGSGGDLGGNGGDGGGGGGGLQITSRELIRIRPAGGGGVTPGIWAGGGGGEGGGFGNGGGGGGAGGAILLEAPIVDIRPGAILAANGGGGGEGDGGGNGQDGLLANSPAGGGGGTVVRHGGKGGYGTIAPEPGDGPGDGTGGGGGGAGIIRVNANSATLDGVLSPPATTGSITVE